MKQFFLLPLSLALTSLCFADRPSPTQDEFPLGVNKPVNPMPYLRAEALLWQAVEDNLDYAYTRKNFPATPENENNRDIIKPHFDWSWGYRVGADYELPSNGWDIGLFYMSIANHANGIVRGTGTEDPAGKSVFIYQVWGQPGNALADNIIKAIGHWKVNLDQLDFNSGRSYYVGKHLILRPFAGVRSTWLYQKYSIEYKNEFDIHQRVHLRNKFWGFGLVGGIDTDCLLGAGFSLFGQFDYSVLLGFFAVHQQDVQESVKQWDLKKSFRSGKSILDAKLGLKWSRLFFNGDWGIDLKAAYEYHLYFNQNQYVSHQGDGATTNLFHSNEGNLAYQGGSLTFQINF